MSIKLCLFLIQYIILGCQYNFHHVKAMIGTGVRIAATSEFPFVVSIALIPLEDPTEVNAIHFCTGTLITKKDVATAANCLADQPQHQMRIIAGSNDLTRGIRYVIDWWITFEHWAVFNGVNMNFDENNIAHIRLQRSVRPSIEPIRLFSLHKNRLSTHSADMIGWSRYNATIMDPLLKTARVSCLIHRECLRLIHRLGGTPYDLDARQLICAVGHPLSVITPGDLGGPLIYHGRLAGIIQRVLPEHLQEGDLSAVNTYLSVQYYKLFFDSNSEDDS